MGQCSQEPIEFSQKARNIGVIRKPTQPAMNAPAKNAAKFLPIIRKKVEDRFQVYLDRTLQAFSLLDDDTLEVISIDTDILFEAVFSEIEKINRTLPQGV